MGRSHKARPFRQLARLIGPGFIAGASDDDPSGIGTYAIAGASLGFATLWTALFTYPLMAGVQFMSAKIAIVTGEGLGCVVRKHYPAKVLYVAVGGARPGKHRGCLPQMLCPPGDHRLLSAKIPARILKPEARNRESSPPSASEGGAAKGTPEASGVITGASLQMCRNKLNTIMMMSVRMKTPTPSKRIFMTIARVSFLIYR